MLCSLCSRDFLIRPFNHCKEYRMPLLFSSLTPNHVIIFPPVLAQLHWLPVNQRIIYKLCLPMHLVHVKHCPDYLNNLVHLTADSATRPGWPSFSQPPLVPETGFGVKIQRTSLQLCGTCCIEQFT